MTSGHLLFFSKIIQNYCSQTIFFITVCESSGLGGYIFVSVRDRLGSSSDLLKSWGGGSVAVACGVRLSCSVFTVLLSVSLVARALSIALRLQVYKRREHHDM